MSSNGVIAKRYAKALFEIAAEKNQLDQIEEELHALHSVLQDHPEFLQLLHHPQIDKKVKQREFKTIFEGSLSEMMLSFMIILIERGREETLELIIENYTRYANRDRGLADATVTSINPLSEQESTNLENSFSKITNKKIRIQNIVDPSILGGVVVKIGDLLYDGSVKGKLNRFKRRVLTSKS